MAEVFKVPPIRTNAVPELNKWAVEVNKLFARVSERLDDRKRRLTLTGDLDAAGFRIKNLSAPKDEDDATPVGRLQDILDELDQIDIDEETSESDEEGLGQGRGRRGRRGRKGRQTTSRFRRIIDDEISQVLIDAIPTVAPPNVAAVSALGTTTDPIKFALSDHTHGGVLGAPPAGGAAGEVAFFTSSFELGSDPKFFWNDTDKSLVIGELQSTGITINGGAFGPAHVATHDDTTLGISLLAGMYHNTAQSAAIYFARSRGTPSAKTVVADDDHLGDFLFLGYDGTDFERGARIHAQIDETTPGAAAMGTELLFETTPKGSVTLGERFVIGTTRVRLLGSSLTTGTRRIDFNDLASISIDGIRPGATMYGVDLAITNAAGIIASMETGAKDFARNTWTINQALVSAVGAGGRIFTFLPIVKNLAATAIADMGIWSAMEFAPQFRADGAACTVPFVRAFRDSLTSDIINAGTLAITEHTSLYSEPSYGASVTTTTRRGLWYRNRASTGTQTNSIAVDVDDQTIGTLAAAVRSAIASGTGKWFLLSTGTAVSAILGGVRLGNGTTGPTGSSVLHVDGGCTQKLTVTTDADYTALVTDFVIQFPAITANRVLNLPAAATAAAGKVYYVIKTTGAFTITIDPNGAELVNGAATLAAFGAASTYDTVRLVCSGTEWFASLMV